MFTLYLYFSLGLFFWLTALLIFIRSEERAFFFLAGHFIIMGIGIVTRCFQYNGMILSYPHFYGILSPLQLLYGPFYFFYLIKLFDKKYTISMLETLHFVPFLFNLIDFIPFYVLPPDQKVAIIQAGKEISFFGLTSKVYEYIKMASFACYLLWGVRFYLLRVYYTQISAKRDALLIHYWLRFDVVLKVIAVCTYLFVNLKSTPDSFTLFYYLFSADAVFNAMIINIKPFLLKGFALRQQHSAKESLFSFSAFCQIIRRNVFFRQNEQDVERRINVLFSRKQVHSDPDFDVRAMAISLGLRIDKLEDVISNKYHCTASCFIQFKRLEQLSFMRKDHTVNELLTKLLFVSGFDSIVTLQASLLSFQSYEHKSYFPAAAQAVNDLILVLDKMFAKQQ